MVMVKSNLYGICQMFNITFLLTVKLHYFTIHIKLCKDACVCSIDFKQDNNVSPWINKDLLLLLLLVTLMRYGGPEKGFVANGSELVWWKDA